jgi:hypothetical protein
MKLILFLHSVWTQDLLLVRQVLYDLNHTPIPFAFSLFFRQGFMLDLTALALNPDPPTSTSQA